MKKYLMVAVALICMTLICVSFSACSNTEYDETENIIRYDASGNVIGEGDENFGAQLYSWPYYNTVISEVLNGKSYTTSSKDAEVIAACDKLYESQRAKYSTWKGTITITKYKGLNDKTGTVLKTYTFG